MYIYIYVYIYIHMYISEARARTGSDLSLEDGTSHTAWYRGIQDSHRIFYGVIGFKKPGLFRDVITIFSNLCSRSCPKVVNLSTPNPSISNEP